MEKLLADADVPFGKLEYGGETLWGSNLRRSKRTAVDTGNGKYSYSRASVHPIQTAKRIVNIRFLGIPRLQYQYGTYMMQPG